MKQLDGKFAPNAIDAGLFSPSQQSRSDEATIGADCGQISEPARLLATAFLLDQPETSSNFGQFLDCWKCFDSRQTKNESLAKFSGKSVKNDGAWGTPLIFAD